MADINQELVIIMNGRYGRDIRDAIADALRKVNSGGGGGGGDLSDYYTKTEIDEKLLLYLPSTAVPNIIQGVLQEVALSYYDKTIVDDMLSDYVTETDLSSTLNSYCTLAELDATLGNYVSVTYLGTRLNDYYNKTQVDSLIASIDSMPHVICTQTQYDNMQSHDEGTLYFIKGETSVTLYLGDLPVNTGGGGGTNSQIGSLSMLTSGPTTTITGTNEEV